VLSTNFAYAITGNVINLQRNVIRIFWAIKFNICTALTLSLSFSLSNVTKIAEAVALRLLANTFEVNSRQPNWKIITFSLSNFLPLPSPSHWCKSSQTNNQFSNSTQKVLAHQKHFNAQILNGFSIFLLCRKKATFPL